MNYLEILSSLTVIAFSSTGLLLYLYQSSLIYPANLPTNSREIVDTPDLYDIPYKDVTLLSDGYKINCYLLHQSNKAVKTPTVLFFHANAGNMGHRLPLAEVFYKRFNYNVLMVSYRGYGKSEGKPSESGLRMDAEVALKYLKKEELTRDNEIILYGQSIGGAVCIDLASNHPDDISALILENTFRSIPSLIPTLLPLLRPFTFLCTEIWNSEQSIKKIKTHILFLSGTQDEIVPVSHMRKLHSIHQSSVKDGIISSFKSFPNGTHNDTCLDRKYWNTVEDFLLEINQRNVNKGIL